MQICWKYQPRERPTFRQIVELLFDRASDDFREVLLPSHDFTQLQLLSNDFIEVCFLLSNGKN